MHSSKKRLFANSVDPDATRGVSSGSALFAMLSSFLVTVGIINSYTNQDILALLMGAKPSKGVLKLIMPSYITPLPKLELDRLELLFPQTFCMRVIKNSSELG